MSSMFEEQPKNQKASQAIKNTWTDDTVRQKRKRRIAVEVNGEQYGSCRKAFQALGLPEKKSDSVRAQLKEQGDQADFEGYVFTATS